MKCNNLLLVVFGDHSLRTLGLEEDCREDIEVVNEELVELVEEADTLADCLLEVIVALLDVLVSTLFMLMELAQLIA